MRGVTIGLPSDTPTRTGGQQAFRTVHREKRWSRDIPAYRRLRAEGLRPPRIDGAARAEATAASPAQVEGRQVP